MKEYLGPTDVFIECPSCGEKITDAYRIFSGSADDIGNMTDWNTGFWNVGICTCGISGVYALFREGSESCARFNEQRRRFFRAGRARHEKKVMEARDRGVIEEWMF